MRFTFTTDPAELDRAAEYARRAIAAAPTLAEPHVWLGYALMRQGQMDDALASELRAADLDAGSAFAPVLCRRGSRPSAAVRRRPSRTSSAQ